jgi:flagellar biosynthesis protein FlhA
MEGQATREPAFGLNALWIPGENADLARRSGYTVVDAINVLGTHLTEIMRRHAHEIFSRQDAKAFCDRVAQDSPKTVEDLTPKLLPLSSVQKVLQNLLREGVPIRDGVSILEALGEGAQSAKNTTLLTEFVRQNIRRTLVKPYLSPAGELRVYFTDLAIEQLVEGTVEHGEQSSVAPLARQSMRSIVEKIQQPLTPEWLIVHDEHEEHAHNWHGTIGQDRTSSSSTRRSSLVWYGRAMRELMPTPCTSSSATRCSSP